VCTRNRVSAPHPRRLGSQPTRPQRVHSVSAARPRRVRSASAARRRRVRSASAARRRRVSDGSCALGRRGQVGPYGTLGTHEDSSVSHVSIVSGSSSNKQKSWTSADGAVVDAGRGTWRNSCGRAGGRRRRAGDRRWSRAGYAHGPSHGDEACLPLVGRTSQPRPPVSTQQYPTWSASRTAFPRCITSTKYLPALCTS
jgi:hypothetical protein